MKTATALGLLVLLATPLWADSHHVEVDARADFTAFKTFVIREGRASSRNAEINNQLLLTKIQDSIRTGLTTAGLRETPNRADLVVTFTLGEQGQRGTVGRGIRDMRVVTTSEGTLVIEMLNGANLVWYGTYTDEEANPAKLARRLPEDAKKLLRQLPPNKKK
jgi:hypothetical protein